MGNNTSLAYKYRDSNQAQAAYVHPGDKDLADRRAIAQAGIDKFRDNQTALNLASKTHERGMELEGAKETGLNNRKSMDIGLSREALSSVNAERDRRLGLDRDKNTFDIFNKLQDKSIPTAVDPLTGKESRPAIPIATSQALYDKFRGQGAPISQERMDAISGGATSGAASVTTEKGVTHAVGKDGVTVTPANKPGTPKLPVTDTPNPAEDQTMGTTPAPPINDPGARTASRALEAFNKAAPITTNLGHYTGVQDPVSMYKRGQERRQGYKDNISNIQRSIVNWINSPYKK